MAKRIPRKAIFRPLQGGMRVVGGAGYQPSLSQQYQNALNQANQANERRYQQILGGYQGLRGRVMGDLANQGTGERADIARLYQNKQADLMQWMINRGFGNSNLPWTQGRGINRDMLEMQGRLNDRLRQQRAAADIGITQGELGVMERRTDMGPDLNQAIQLGQALGQGGYGGGGFGGGIRGVTFNQDGYRQMYNQALMRAMMGAVPSGPNYRVGPLQYGTNRVPGFMQRRMQFMMGRR